ncbi:recombinase family protein [Pseudomonas sp. NPDC089428]|uniref:recombinase family protein n=1 Tax=Pseudomonas sp. NPDC089428 TaxID=3364467 RepID=UPI0037F156DD
MNVVAYIRVSTKGQGDSGLGLEAQQEYITRAAQQNGWNILSTYVDVASGKLAPSDRPECSKALAECKARGAVLVVAKLDRLSRSVLHIAQLMEVMDFKVATMPQANTFQLHLFAALAQQEREFISQRTKEALAALQKRADDGDVVAMQKVANRAQAQRKGRTEVPSDNLSQANVVRVSRAKMFNESIRIHIESCLYNGVTKLVDIAGSLNAKGVTTSRGGVWQPTQVKRVVDALCMTL